MPPGGVRELKWRRLVIPGLTEAQVRAVWGNPQETTELPPRYKSLTYETPRGWIAVVFDAGRVLRVEDFRTGAPSETGKTPDAP